MVWIHRCQVELHDSLYYATREIGRLYETEAVLHNYALCYALGLVDNERYQTQVDPKFSYRYFCAEQVPLYEEHLSALNRQGLYVTPAYAVHYSTVLNTWKYANNNYHVEMEKTQKNIPIFGRAKEIAAESRFEFFVLAAQRLRLPQWIRLGKWLSKAEISILDTKEIQASTLNKEFDYPHLLNPLDVMFSHQVYSYDTVNMPPVSLIKHVRLQGQYYDYEGLKIPVMQFHFNAP
jgi:CRISPR-associated protein Csc1